MKKYNDLLDELDSSADTVKKESIQPEKEKSCWTIGHRPTVSNGNRKSSKLKNGVIKNTHYRKILDYTPKNRQ